jgi:hypothetical protein
MYEANGQAIDLLRSGICDLFQHIIDHPDYYPAIYPNHNAFINDLRNNIIGLDPNVDINAYIQNLRDQTTMAEKCHAQLVAILLQRPIVVYNPRADDLFICFPDGTFMV